MTVHRPVKGSRCQSASPFTIALLGPPHLALPKQQIALHGSKSEALLVLLAIFHHTPVARTFLLDQLWPDGEATLAGQALSSLTSELNRLGRQQGSQANLLICEHNYVGFNLADGISTDIEAFDHLHRRGLALLAQGDEPAGRQCCQAALALYRGDLCGDENIHVVIERERLRIAMLDLLRALADQAYRCGDLNGALGHLQRILVHRPYREDIHRQLMAHYAQMGLRTRALNQYRVCERILAAEFAIEPEAATKQLYQQLCRGETTSVSPLLGEGVSAEPSTW